MKQQILTFVLSEIEKNFRGEILKTHPSKSNPHYFYHSIPTQIILNEKNIEVNGQKNVFKIKVYPNDILIVETLITVDNIFNDNILIIKNNLIDAAYKIIKEYNGSEEFSEQYSIYTISNYEGDLKQFLKYDNKIAVLLKSENNELSQEEINYTLNSKIQYAKNDLALVDWDGAFLLDPNGDFDSTIELIQIANLQLLRYRILDRKLDEKFQHISTLIRKLENQKFFKTKELEIDLKKIIHYQADAINQFQSIERDIKLIGDWYSARFYDLISKKLKLTEWREIIKDKINSLNNLYTTLSENFSISSAKKAEIIQTIGWFILQIGWLILIVLEFLSLTRK
ncbi:MAG: hypothetical protein ACP5IC_01885 [Minisyncoccia bacterium]